MKTTQQQFKIVALKRLNNSIYGNPKWALTLTDESGELYHAKTASNSSAGYVLGYTSEGKTYTMQYHYTSNGYMIIDYIK